MSETTLPAIPPVEADQQLVVTLLEKARAVVVSDRVSCDYANAFLTWLVDRKKWWSDKHIENKKAAYNAYQVALRLHDDPINEIDTARKAITSTRDAWILEQRRIEAELARQAAEEARKQAEADAEAVAEALEADGELEAAEAVLEQAIQARAPVVHIQTEVPKTTRATAFRQPVWTAEIINVEAFWAASGIKSAYREFFTLNVGQLNKRAKDLGIRFNGQFPGVRAVQK